MPPIMSEHIAMLVSAGIATSLERQRGQTLKRSNVGTSTSLENHLDWCMRHVPRHPVLLHQVHTDHVPRMDEDSGAQVIRWHHHTSHAHEHW